MPSHFSFGSGKGFKSLNQSKGVCITVSILGNVAGLAEPCQKELLKKKRGFFIGPINTETQGNLHFGPINKWKPTKHWTLSPKRNPGKWESCPLSIRNPLLCDTVEKVIVEHTIVYKTDPYERHAK